MRVVHFKALVIMLAPVSARGQALQSPPIEPPASCSIVQVFGDANVRNVVSEGDDASNTTGSIGMRYYGPAWMVVGSISVAGRSDTLRSAFGSTLLPPASGRAFNAGLVDLRMRRLPFIGEYRYLTHLGFHVYGSASSSIWALADTIHRDMSSPILPQSFEVPVWGAGAGLYYQFFGGSINDSNHVSMLLDVGWAQRSLRGDLFSDGGTAGARELIRRALLGSDERSFNGLEVGLSMYFNGLKAGLTYYYFGNGDGPSVDGLTGGQVVAGIGLQTTLASDWLRSSIAGATRRVGGRAGDTLAMRADSIERWAKRLERRARELRRGGDTLVGPEADAELHRADSLSSEASRMRLIELDLRMKARSLPTGGDPRSCARLALEARTGFVPPPDTPAVGDSTTVPPDTAAVGDTLSVPPDSTAVGDTKSLPPDSMFASRTFLVREVKAGSSRQSHFVTHRLPVNPLFGAARGNGARSGLRQSEGTLRKAGAP